MTTMCGMMKLNDPKARLTLIVIDDCHVWYDEDEWSKGHNNGPYSYPSNLIISSTQVTDEQYQHQGTCSTHKVNI